MEFDLRQAVGALTQLSHRPWWRPTRLFAILLLLVGVTLLTTSFWVPFVDPAPLSYENLPWSAVVVQQDLDRTTVVVTALRCTTAQRDLQTLSTYSFYKPDNTGEVSGHSGVSTIPAGNVCSTLEATLSSQAPLSPGEWLVNGRTTVQTRWRTQEFNWRSQPFVVE